MIAFAQVLAPSQSGAVYRHVRSGEWGSRGRSPSRAGAFTLIEMMIVVAIMGIMCAIGVPIVYKITHRAPMVQAITGVSEVCSNARKLAIMQSTMVQVVVHPKDGRFEVAMGGAPGPSQPAPAGGEPPPQDSGPVPVAAPANSGLSTTLSDHLVVEMLDINLSEWKDADVARIRFFPNGTCDEFTLILHSDQNEWKKLWLEVTTGLLNVEDMR